MKGYSLPEVLVTLSLTSIVTAIAVLNFDGLLNKAEIASDELVSLYKVVRSRAISNTQAYLLEAESPTRVKISRRASCSVDDELADPWVEDVSLSQDLPNGAVLVLDDFDGDGNTELWEVCLSSRGFPDSNLEFSINDNDGETRVVEIFLGGSVEVF